MVVTTTEFPVEKWNNQKYLHIYVHKHKVFCIKNNKSDHFRGTDEVKVYYFIIW